MSTRLQACMVGLFNLTAIIARAALALWLRTRSIAAALLARTAYIVLCAITPHLI